MDALKKRPFLFSGKGGLLQLILLVCFVIFLMNAFFEEIDVLLAILLLMFVCTVAAKAQHGNPLGWGFLVPIYCLMLYAIIPSLLHGFEIKDAFRNLEGLTTAIFLVSGFVAVFAITYFIAERILQVLRQGKKSSLLEGAPFSVLEWPVASFFLFPITAFSLWYSYVQGYFGLHASEDVGAFAGLATIGQLLLVLWCSYVSVQYWDVKQRVRFLIPLVLSLGLFTLAGILSNSKAAIIAPLLILGLSRFATTSRFPLIIFISALAILIFFAFPIVSVLRAQAHGRTYDILGDFTEIQNLLSDWASDPISMFTTLEHIDRSLLIVLSNAVSSIGSGMELLYGETYVHALATFVPRIMWPEKPDMDIGNLIGHQFGFLALTDVVTSISPGYIGEAYMNFGTLGCLVGAVVLGLFAVILDNLIVGYSKYGKIIFALNILWMEGAIGHTIFPFIKGMAVISLLLLMLMLVRRVFAMGTGVSRTREYPRPS